MNKSAITPRPPAQLILTTPEHLLAFGFGAGLSPIAPGTVGSIVGLLLFLPLSLLPLTAFGIVAALLFLFGCWVCGESARLLGVHDYGGIVFDEIVGYLIAAAPLLMFPALPALGFAGGVVLAFALFRLFDILKPWPIRALDRRVHGGLGIMLDDAVAGLAAAVLLWGALRITTGW